MNNQTGEYNLLDYLKEQDLLRSQNFAEYYPELYKLFD